jgi:glyoxylase-like metal-dependent hydrolase (beta-lactamase superfamily II)
MGAWLLPLAERWQPPEPTPPDVLLTDGESLEAFGLEGIAVHTPGHTPGSSCLLVRGRIAFAGDLISRTGIPHAQRLYADDWSAVAESVQRLQQLAPEWTYAGHGRRPIGKALLAGLSAG